MAGRVYSAREMYVEFGGYKITDIAQIETAMVYNPITPSGSIVLSTDASTIIKPANVKAEFIITVVASSTNNNVLALLEKSKRLVSTPNGQVLPGLSGIISGAVDAVPFSILSTASSDIFHTGIEWIFKSRASFDAPKTDVEQLNRSWTIEFIENSSTLLGSLGYAA